MEIIIPSMNRPECITEKWFKKGLKICVPESQKTIYEKNNSCEIITHSDNIIGLSNKRNYIIETYKEVFMIDDDIKEFKSHYRNGKIEPDEIIEAIEEMNYISKEIGINLYGFTSDQTPIHYTGHEFYKFNGCINGCNIGCNENIKFPSSEHCTAVEDIFVSIKEQINNVILIDQRYTPLQIKTFVNRGGQSMYRTLESEKKDNDFLRKTFGDKMFKKYNIFNRK